MDTVVAGNSVCKDVSPLVTVPAAVVGFGTFGVRCDFMQRRASGAEEGLACGDKGVVFPGGVYSFAGLE